MQNKKVLDKVKVKRYAASSALAEGSGLIRRARASLARTVRSPVAEEPEERGKKQKHLSKSNKPKTTRTGNKGLKEGCAGVRLEIPENIEGTKI